MGPTLIGYLANYLPWRRFPLLGTWEVDLAATEGRLSQQLPDKSRVQSNLQSIAADRWVFTKTHSKRKPREDGNEMLFKLDLIDQDRFEFFEPLRGYSVVWKRI